MRIASRLGIALIATLAAAPLPAQTQPSADELLATAKTQAAGKRAIFGIFHASW